MKYKIIIVVLVLVSLFGCASLQVEQTETKPLVIVILDDALVIGLGAMIGMAIYQEVGMGGSD